MHALPIPSSFPSQSPFLPPYHCPPTTARPARPAQPASPLPVFRSSQSGGDDVNCGCTAGIMRLSGVLLGANGRTSGTGMYIINNSVTFFGRYSTVVWNHVRAISDLAPSPSSPHLEPFLLCETFETLRQSFDKRQGHNQHLSLTFLLHFVFKSHSSIRNGRTNDN